MPFEIITTSNMGFCQGVRRAIERVLDVAKDQPKLETLGALVHNKEVQRTLESSGVTVVDSIDDITGNRVVISAHGVSPEITRQLEKRGIKIIDTTCPYVRRAQQAALKLHQAGFYVIVFGDCDHVEVRGILGWTEGEGIATLDIDSLINTPHLPRKLGILSQTTQIPARFVTFTSLLIESDIFRDAELHIIDTICHDSRCRQAETLHMANQCDLVFVIGGRHSANTRHLKELCSTVTTTHLIERASEIDPSLLSHSTRVGVTAGASTDDNTIKAVINELQALSESYTICG
jgi:4-hydroxy-3-methylbut-2-enyl diphosphate reductase